MPTYICIDVDDIDDEEISPEEVKVKRESEQAVCMYYIMLINLVDGVFIQVKVAKRLLEQIPEQILHSIQSKQIARTILSKEAEMVKSMMDEGQ